MQFDPLPNLRLVHLGLLWEQFKADYPDLQEHPPLAPIEERFGTESHTSDQQIQFMLGPPPVPRVWFGNFDGSRLIQVQQDRFIHNWRSTPERPEYPRYPELRGAFQTHYQAFCAFVEGTGGDIEGRQAEVSYVNELRPGDGWERPGELYRVLRTLSPRAPDSPLPIPEDARYAERHVIEGPDGPYARLYIIAEPLITGRMQLTLTVRGRPRDGSAKSLLDFFDMGRERIVENFDLVTTPEMHTIWKKRINDD